MTPYTTVWLIIFIFITIYFVHDIYLWWKYRNFDYDGYIRENTIVEEVKNTLRTTCCTKDGEDLIFESNLPMNKIVKLDMSKIPNLYVGTKLLERIYSK